MKYSNRHIFILVILVFLLFTLPALPDVILSVIFCRPAALLVALLTGGELCIAHTEILVRTPGLRLAIPPACSGAAFCTMLIMLLGWETIRRQYRRALIGIIPAAYVITLAANTVRIIVVSRWEMNCNGWLPLPLPLQHQLIGMMVFLPAMTAAYAAFYYYSDSLLKQDCRSVES